MQPRDLTFPSGLQALRDKAAHFREQADRFERLAEAVEEAERVLRSTNGELRPKVGRPKNGSNRTAMRTALAAMSDRFTLSQLRHEVKGMSKDIFRRLLRELIDDGVIVERVKAMGRRDGQYEKGEQAVPS